ncbi:MAG TPA: NACHT domain-containing protein [Actinospica sp.]|jgi:hypothetical protein|nr:NACHT domain-containing protein [Actinospica sp.]
MLSGAEFTVLSNLLQNVMGELIAHLLETVAGRARKGRADRRRIEEEAAPISARLTRRLLEDGIRQHPEISASDWEAALLRLREAIRSARGTGVDPVLASGLHPDRLAGILTAHGSAATDGFPVTSGAHRAYEWLLSAVSPLIIEEFEQRPDADTQLIKAILQLVIVIREALDALTRNPQPVDRVPEHPELTAPPFEPRYLTHVARSLGRFELFGVNRGREPSKQTFDESYVSLTVARTSDPDSPTSPDEEEELTGAGVAVSNALSGRKRVILRGSAGSGKTTLLSWLAANGAAGRLTGESGPWGEVVPFVVRLRDFTNRPLPRVEELPAITAPAIDGERPPGWATSTFATGRALLLVDGVDELSAERRDDVQTWIEGLVDAYPEARYVVTVRPFAVPTSWLGQAPYDFDGFDLLPLSAKGIRDFLYCWHEAAKRDQDEARRMWLDQCRVGLDELMQGPRPELRRLATSPLLCGLLCALYQDRDMELPRDRRSLLSAALDLLLFRWNEQHGFPADGSAAPSREEQTILLQRFAYSMVRNQDLVVDRQHAVQRISAAMRGMRSHGEDPQRVLSYVLERTGLFQEPRSGQIQFVHRTFRDYLAAKEIVESGDLSFLLEQAHLDQWHEVVIMAMAHARPHERAGMLRDLLRGNQAAQHDRRLADRLHLLAAASLEQADVLDDNEIRATVENAAARLIPPSSFEEAALLARAGEFVLELLPGPEGQSEQQMAHVVRTIATIGGAASIDKIRAYSLVNKTMVVDELLRAWRESDNPEEYARTVLAQIEFGDREVKVQGWHKVLLLHHLRGLLHLNVPGDLTPLSPVAEIPNLTRLSLFQNYALRDISPLRASTSLRTLQLSGCTFLTDLRPLRDTKINELHLYHMERVDLATLAGSPVTTLVLRDDRLATGLTAIPAAPDLDLTRLRIDNLADRRDLSGITRWPALEHVECSGIPTPDELAELKQLPKLRALTLRLPATPTQTQTADLQAIQSHLPSVRVTRT